MVEFSGVADWPRAEFGYTRSRLGDGKPAVADWPRAEFGYTPPPSSRFNPPQLRIGRGQSLVTLWRVRMNRLWLRIGRGQSLVTLWS